jgi:hypothetical protein
MMTPIPSGVHIKNLCKSGKLREYEAQLHVPYSKIRRTPVGDELALSSSNGKHTGK